MKRIPEKFIVQIDNFHLAEFYLLLELLRPAVLPAFSEAQDGRFDRHPSGSGQRRSGQLPAQGKG